MVEVAFVRLLAELRRQGRNVEAEEATARHGDGRNDIDVANNHLEPRDLCEQDQVWPGEWS